jgi:hypothetical protein
MEGKEAYRRAASRAASRTSGFSALFFWIISKVAPTMDLEYGFLVARRLFFTVSAAMSCQSCEGKNINHKDEFFHHIKEGYSTFLCCFLYIAVQVSFEGFKRLWKYLLHFELANRKT